MTDQHRATPEQWEHVQISAGMKQQIPWATADCLLELRARIEAMEAAQQIRVFSAEEVAPIVVPASVARPAGGLVERVTARIEYGIDAELDPEGIACAAIRELAKWLRDRYPKSPEAGAVAFNLYQEVNHG
jgi:anti-sigma factor RsiW